MSYTSNSSMEFKNLKSLIKHLENNPSEIIHLEGLDKNHIAFLKASRSPCWNFIPEHMKTIDIFVHFPYVDEIHEIGKKMSEDLYWAAGEKRFHFFPYIQNKNKSFKMCSDAFSHDEELIKHFPDKFKHLFTLSSEKHKSMVEKNTNQLIEAISKIINHDDEYFEYEDCDIAQKIRFINNIDTRSTKYDLLLRIVALSGNALEYIPDEYITLEMCKYSVAKNPEYYKYVPSRFASKELWDFAQRLPRSIEPMDSTILFSNLDEEEKSYELSEAAVYEDGGNISSVPIQYLTPELYRIAVKHDLGAFIYFPEELKTIDMCIEALKSGADETLAFIPDKYKSYELCLFAVCQNGLALQFVPEKFKTHELCNVALSNTRRAISYCPEDMVTYDLVYSTIKEYPRIIARIPEKFTNKELWSLAFDKDPFVITSMPKEYVTNNMVAKAIKDKISTFDYLPDHYKTPELCLTVVKKNGDSFRYVPDELKTEEMCIMAIRQGAWNISYVPERLLTKEMCFEAVKQSFGYYYRIPNHLRSIPASKIVFEEGWDKEIDDELFEEEDILTSMSSFVFRKRKLPIRKNIKNPRYWFGIGIKYGSNAVPAQIACGPYRFK